MSAQESRHGARCSVCGGGPADWIPDDSGRLWTVQRLSIDAGRLACHYCRTHPNHGRRAAPHPTAR